MQASHCPVCSSPLETREVAPCYDCGHRERELAELDAGELTYAEFEIFGQPLVLCDFCDADFGSYYPSYFGLPDNDRQPLDGLKFIRDVDPSTQARFDKYCSECSHRLAFLKFLAVARLRNQSDG